MSNISHTAGTSTGAVVSQLSCAWVAACPPTDDAVPPSSEGQQIPECNWTSRCTNRPQFEQWKLVINGVIRQNGPHCWWMTSPSWDIPPDLCAVWIVVFKKKSIPSRIACPARLVEAHLQELYAWKGRILQVFRRCFKLAHERRFIFALRKVIDAPRNYDTNLW